MEHNKTKVFHFSRSHGAFIPPLLDLSSLGGPYLLLKTTQKYLGFIFDHKLLFQAHIDFYMNKAISIVKCIKMLGNSTRSLIPLQKQHIYRCCVLPIELYSFQLQYYNKVSLYYPLNILIKMQCRAAIQITGAFHTSPMEGIEAIAELISIYLYLKKLYDRFLLREFLLPSNYIIKLFTTHDNPQSLTKYQTSLIKLTSKQVLCLKSPFVDIDNRCNEFFPVFSLLDKEFSSGNHLCDSFPDHISFYPRPQDIKIQIHKLNNIVIVSSLDHLLYIVVSDTSIKNYIAISISHIHLFNQLIIKTCYQVINIFTTEVELFTIRYSINQAVGIPNIKQIIVITNSLHAAKRIFNLFSHLYQLQSAVISCKLREFFYKGINNSIKFWDCLSKENQYLHLVLDKDSKNFTVLVCFPSMFSWDSSEKHVCNDIISQWKMTFQASNFKERSFLDLLNSDSNPLRTSYINEGLWLQYFGHSNLLCARATRAIVNHAPISEYRLRFFPRENFSYPCGVYFIET